MFKAGMLFDEFIMGFNTDSYHQSSSLYVFKATVFSYSITVYANSFLCPGT